MTGPWRLLDGPAGVLRCYTTGSPAPEGGSTLVVAHELPLTQSAAAEGGRTFPSLADQIAQESGWRVVTATLRGVGGSTGDFSAAGWLEDLAFIAAREIEPEEPRWVAGFGFGGALALRMAADDPTVRGVTCLGTPADLAAWAGDAALFAARCRLSGAVSSPGYPPDVAAWAAQLDDLDPVGAAGRLGSRPLLVVHGAADTDVPLADARSLAEAAERSELRVVPGAGHWLRADPRVVATLIGWLERRA